MREVIVLQHADCEPAAAFGDELVTRGCVLRVIHADRGDPLPEDPAACPIVAMGGPMGAADDLPWLAAERRFIARAVGAGTPYWGVCLGAQLLAASLGARVWTGAQPEVGVREVRLSDAAGDDPVFGGCPARLHALQWHADSFDLPDGATLLAGGDAYAHQAFRVGGAAYGLQFHLEADVALTRSWHALPEYAASLEQAAGPGAIHEMLADLERHDGTALARDLIGRWADIWR